MPMPDVNEVKATLEFTSAQVSEILAQYVKQNYPLLKDTVTASNVSFSISQGGSNGHSGHYSPPSLNAAKVEVKLKPASK